MANNGQGFGVRTLWAMPSLLFVVMLVVCSEASPVTRRDTLIHDGLTRTFRLFVPANPRTPAPLVVVLHGGGGSGAIPPTANYRARQPRYECDRSDLAVFRSTQPSCTQGTPLRKRSGDGAGLLDAPSLRG
jgi:hypothetical protein